MRVVSLLPAATEIVAALGGGGYLVGVSHECDYPPDVMALPRVTRARVDTSLPSRAIDRAMAEARQSGTSPVEVDVELLARLRPDVVIGQAVCDVCAVGDRELARIVPTLMPIPWVVTLHAHTLVEVLVDIRRVAEAVELGDEADELIAGLAYRLRRLRASHAAAAPRPRILVVEWLEPPYVAGHWVPELIEAAGGQDVGSAPGNRSVIRSWGELRRLAPDVVVIALCGFDVPRARRELMAVTDPDARALLEARVELIDGHAYTSRPGPRLVDAAELLARLIRS